MKRVMLTMAAAAFVAVTATTADAQGVTLASDMLKDWQQ